METSALFQVPISYADVAMFKNPESQPDLNPINCAAVSAQLLRIVSDAESESITRQQVGQYFHEWLRYVNLKKPSGVTAYTFDTTRFANIYPVDAVRAIEGQLFPGFATMVLVTRIQNGQEITGHYFVIAKDAASRTFILDPQVRYVVQSHQMKAYLEQTRLTDGYTYAFQVNPQRTADQFRTDFRSGFSVFDNIERSIVRVQNMTFRVFRMRDMEDDVLREIDKVLATCFESAGGLMRIPSQLRGRYGLILGASSNTAEAFNLQNIATNVHFVCVLTKVTDTHFYLSHVCIHRAYRGRHYMREFVRMLIDSYPKHTFSLIAAKERYEGMGLTDRISLYSRFGFYITPGTWIRFRDVFGQLSDWYKVQNGYIHRNGPPGRTVTYTVLSKEGFQQSIHESQIEDCGPSDGAPMQSSSAEIRGILPPEVCELPVMIQNARAGRRVRN